MTVDRRRRPITHGTLHGYRRCPTKCEACRAAVRDYDRNRRPRPSARRRAAKVAGRRAMAQLARCYPGEYQRYLAGEPDGPRASVRWRAWARLAQAHRSEYLRLQYEGRAR